MASATNTKKSKPAWRRRRLFGGMILRILAVNVVAPLILLLGVLYMGQYRDNLIAAELETLKAHTQLFAGAVAESAVRPVAIGRPFLFAPAEEVEMLQTDLSRRMVKRLTESMGVWARIFNVNGGILADSSQLTPRMGPASDQRAPTGARRALSNMMRYLSHGWFSTLPEDNRLRPYPLLTSPRALDHPDAVTALKGHVSATAWEDPNGNIILSAAAPIRKARQVMGAVLITENGSAVEDAMVEVRIDVLTIFFVAFSITILLSIYLAGTIGRPLRRLADAAENIREAKSRHVDIPNLSRRHDEIGELSLALRDMTQALWDRMDTIERFAADVAHEIKNPLTSLRSAVETVARVKNAQDHDRLMAIIQHDVQRLDRLISDISNASRLDAELSREKLGEVDLRRLLEQLADMHRSPLARGHGGEGEKPVLLDLPGQKLTVRGNESRLAQVFENLISNALSFSPATPVRVKVTAEKPGVIVSVEDDGPGIPENKLETIFERFYTERPKHEDYGSHSGLGLSIARQIVTAHNGIIYAENIKDETGKVKGARFTVVLEAA